MICSPSTEIPGPEPELYTCITYREHLGTDYYSTQTLIKMRILSARRETLQPSEPIGVPVGEKVGNVPKNAKAKR